MGLSGRFFRALCANRTAAPCRRAAPSVQLRLRPLLEELEPRVVPSVDLGAAASYAVLGLQNTSISNSNVSITGNEGVSQGGKLSNSNHSTITGNVTEYQTGQYSGGGQLGGTISVDPSGIAQADSDAVNASAAAAALTPTQTFGSITQLTVITGNGGLNVIQINGDIKSSLILKGTANDVFILNVTGNLALGGTSTLSLGPGVIASNVLYNFTGASGEISTQSGNVVNGTLLAPNYNFKLEGNFNGEIIGGGGKMTFRSGAHVNQIAFTGNTTPQGSLSGAVLNEATGAGLANVLITLTWTNSQGQQMSLTTYTAANGTYSFTGLQADTYTLSETLPSTYVDQAPQNQVGSLGGSTSTDLFTGIVLGLNGNNFNGSGYVFADSSSSPSIVPSA